MNRREAGYLYEIPCLVVFVLLLVVFVLPLLPLLVAKVVAVLAALVVIAGLYYMIVEPGWQPADIAERHAWSWNLMKFALMALLIAAAATAFVVLVEDKNWPPGRPPAEASPPPG